MADTDDFVSALMARMSRAEKIGQLNLLAAGEGPDTGTPAAQDIRGRLARGEVGAIFGTKSVASVRRWQALALEGSAHAIPLLFAEDVIHGHRTIFPLPLALAGSFDTGLVEETARVAAVEASAEGIAQVYAPMIDVCRDARWGRFAESPGEDPFLAARYAEAMVRGFQGDDLSAPDAVAACLKHFVAYGAAAGGRDYDGASLGARELHDVYLEPFRAGVAAGAASVMAAFNTVDGVPMHAHRRLIEGWLRGVCGFSGVVVADYTGVRELVAHGIGGPDAAVARALLAGVDLDMVGGDYLARLPALAETGIDCAESGVRATAGEVRAAIDQSCARVLALKARLGLFDDPYRRCDEDRARVSVLTPDHRALARRAVAASTVMLKNDGVLPLPATGLRIALVGPLADDRTNLLGTWAVSGDHTQAVTVLEGMRAVCSNEVAVARGASITEDWELADRLNCHGQTVFIDELPPDALLDEAAELAGVADVVVAVVGEAKEQSGESSSRTALDLGPPQRRLVERLAATGRPLVLVVMGGRPLTLGREVALADAVLLPWFGGTETGHGIADVLFGLAEPGGRLAVSLPAADGQVPIHHGAPPTGRPWPGRWQKFTTGYLDLPADQPPARGLFPFGFGQTFTSFRLGAPQVDRTEPRGADETVTVTVGVENAGARFGTEVVQLYVSDPVARVSRPAQELRGFARIGLAPGERGEVRFTLGVGDLGYTDAEGERVWDPGVFVLRTGPNARDTQAVEIRWHP